MRDSSKIMYVILSGILSLVLLASVVLMAIPSTRAKIADKVATNLSPAYAEIKDDNAKQAEEINNLREEVKILKAQLDEIKNSPNFEPGLYTVVSNKPTKTWKELISNGDIVIEETDTGKSLKCSSALDGTLFFDNVEGLTSLEGAFKNTHLKGVYFNNLDTSKVTSMKEMFYNCSDLILLEDLNHLDTSKVTDMSEMFNMCHGLTALDLSSFDTSNVINMNYMFSGCSSLTSLDDVSNFNTSNVTNMNYMFSGCSSLKSLTFGSNFNTSKVTDMSCMFYDCSSLTTLDVSKFDTSNVTNMEGMFSMGFNSGILTSLDLSNFDTHNITNMSSMFRNCSSLTSLDVSKFDTSNVTDMMYMFYECSSLTSLDVSNFDTSNVTNMEGIFYDCSSLTSLDVSNFDTSNIISVREMFKGCSSITTLKLNNLNNLEFNNKASFYDSTFLMFEDCSALISITYPGTIEQWTAKNITNKSTGLTIGTTIHCTDGDYALI